MRVWQCASPGNVQVLAVCMSWRSIICTDRAALMQCRCTIQPGRCEQARGNHGLLQCPWHNCICIWRAQCCAGNPGWFLSATAVVTVLRQSSSLAAITMYAYILTAMFLPWLFCLVSEPLVCASRRLASSPVIACMQAHEHLALQHVPMSILLCLLISQHLPTLSCLCLYFHVTANAKDTNVVRQCGNVGHQHQ